MKRGLLDRIDRCRHVAVCHAHANGVARLKGLGTCSHAVNAVREAAARPRSDAGLLSIVRP